MVVMETAFVKMHGAGNDFVMIDDRAETFPLERAAVAELANRPGGIGCEGVIFVRSSSVADFRMRFFNPDGAEAELCGNGARCVAAFARAIGAARSDRMRFETAAGLIDAEILSPGLVRIRMPDPHGLSGDFVNSGVPHLIVPVDDVSAVDVRGEGRKIRFSDEFAPAGTNVDFVEYRAPGKLKMRTYERGVEDESGACGTGAAAAAVVGVSRYGMKFPVEAETSAGYVLTVDGVCRGGSFSEVSLTGPVETVFSGVWKRHGK
jgi:diaminopimelate epimerase